MLGEDIKVSYAQYREDLILLALLQDVKEGFYVDVGANYPTIDSVTKLFYDDGWRGINIEPLKSLYAQLKAERPKDINLNYGVGKKAGTASLREYTDTPGHSTFDNNEKQKHGREFAYKEYDVEIKTLPSILHEHARDQHIHFMKIDVEGYEYEVVSGANWKKYRPEILCIEANHVGTDWRPILHNAKYRLFIQDGLNEYYVADEAWKRTEGFAERIINLDYTALRQHHFETWQADRKQMKRLQSHIKMLDKHIDGLNTSITALHTNERLSLRNQTYPKRIFRAAYGLTIDWYRFKKG